MRGTGVRVPPLFGVGVQHPHFRHDGIIFDEVKVTTGNYSISGPSLQDATHDFRFRKMHHSAQKISKISPDLYDVRRSYYFCTPHFLDESYAPGGNVSRGYPGDGEQRRR